LELDLETTLRLAKAIARDFPREAIVEGMVSLRGKGFTIAEVRGTVSELFESTFGEIIIPDPNEEELELTQDDGKP